MITNSVWRPTEGPVGPESLCQNCGKIKPGNIPGVVQFHICNNRTDWRNDPNIIKGEVVDD